MALQIRKITASDIPAVIALIRELAEFENLTKYLETTEEMLREAMFGKDAFVSGLIACDGANPVGYALFYPIYSSFRGQKSVCLEDLFIKESYRKHGLGAQMLGAVARAGQAIGAVRMDFQVLNWNESALAFYHKHGAIKDEEERHVKFTDDAFIKLSQYK